MADAPTAIARKAAMTYLTENWGRIAIATFSQGITVPDPGHGLDEICPISYWGMPFDPTKDEFVSQVSTLKAYQLQNNGSNKGTGWLLCQVKDDGPPVTMTPGKIPEMRLNFVLEVNIAVPLNTGEKLSDLYAGVLAMLFRFVRFNPDIGGVDYVRNLEPVPEKALFDFDDDAWSYFIFGIPLSMFYRVDTAGAQ